MSARGIASIVATTLLTIGSTGCGDDGPHTSGPLAARFDEDVSGSVLKPGDAVQLVATEFNFAPGEFVAEAGAYTAELINEGKIKHNITFQNGGSFDVEPGESVAIEFVVPEEGVVFICAISGHKEAGMSGVLHTPGSVASDEPEVGQ